MNFLPPPKAEDVELTDCYYPRDEIVAARRALLDIVQDEKTGAWYRIKQKLGIMPNGQRINSYDPEHVWIPDPLPPIWSARVCLYNPKEAPKPSQVKTESEAVQKRAQEEAGTGKELSQKKVKVERNSSTETNGSMVLQFKVKVEENEARVKVKPNCSDGKIKWGAPAASHNYTSTCSGPAVSSVKSEPAHDTNIGREGEALDKRGHSSTVSMGTHVIKIKHEPDADNFASSSRPILDSEHAHSTKDSDSDDVVITGAKFPTLEPSDTEFIDITSSPAKQKSSGEPTDEHSESHLRSGSNTSSSQGKETTGTRQMKQESTSMKGQIQYRVMFRCDLCPYVCEDEDVMVKHLQKPPGHYSASRYLGIISPMTEELIPKLLSAVSVVRYESHAFMDKIPACPFCHLLFISVGQCAEHCAKNHQAPGLYALRSILSSHKLKMLKNSDKCRICRQRFLGDSMRQHIAKTRHMADCVVRRAGHQSTIVFPCRHCSPCIIHSDYLAHKHHCFTHHSQELDSPYGRRKFFISSCLTLSTQHQAMQLLPQDPGVAARQQIDRDFPDSNPMLPGLAADIAAAIVKGNGDGGGSGKGGSRRKKFWAKRRRRNCNNAGGLSSPEEMKPIVKGKKHAGIKCWTAETAERKKLVKLERRRRRRAVLKSNKKMLAAERKIACTVTSTSSTGTVKVEPCV